MDRLDAMQVLLAVVEAGSLSAASRALNAPLPSISRKVAELERHLSTRLIVRTSRNIQLTDAGRDYVAAAEEILARLDQAERRASGEYDKPRGELTITMPIEFGRLVALPVATAFLEEHPEIRLNVLSTDRILQIAEEHVDIAVRLGNLADSSLSAVKVGEVSLVTCASPAYLKRRGHPVRPGQFSGHDAILFADLDALPWIYACNGRRFEARPSLRVRVNTASAAVAAALGGAGIAKVLNFQVADHLRSGALVPLLENYSGPAIPVNLVYLKQGLMPLKVRSFLDWTAPRLRQALRELTAPAA